MDLDLYNCPMFNLNISIETRACDFLFVGVVIIAISVTVCKMMMMIIIIIIVITKIYIANMSNGKINRQIESEAHKKS